MVIKFWIKKEEGKIFENGFEVKTLSISEAFQLSKTKNIFIYTGYTASEDNKIEHPESFNFNNLNSIAKMHNDALYHKLPGGTQMRFFVEV